MKQFTNTPYRKEFDAEGNLINPIDGSYINHYPNRRTRRASGRERAFSNKKGNRLLVLRVGANKFLKVTTKLQRVKGQTPRLQTNYKFIG